MGLPIIKKITFSPVIPPFAGSNTSSGIQLASSQTINILSECTPARASGDSLRLVFALAYQVPNLSITLR